MSSKEQVIASLVDFGFTSEQAEEAWIKTGGKTLDIALNYLVEQQEGAAPAPEEDSATKPSSSEGAGRSAEGVDGAENVAAALSLKCDECGKQLRNTEDAEVHAARTGHASFSESSDSVQPLTQEQREKQLARLEELRQAKRVQREDEEKAQVKDQELKRREMGKQITNAKHEREKQEAMLIADQRRREKAETAQAKKRIKEEIAKDRADKAAAVNSAKKSAPAVDAGTGTGTGTGTGGAEAPKEKKEYTECKLNIRLPDGKSLPKSFKPEQLLSDVRIFVVTETGMLEFEIGTAFPRKVFAHEDYRKTLKQLGLVPSAAVIISK